MQQPNLLVSTEVGDAQQRRAPLVGACLISHSSNELQKAEDCLLRARASATKRRGMARRWWGALATGWRNTIRASSTCTRRGNMAGTIRARTLRIRPPRLVRASPHCATDRIGLDAITEGIRIFHARIRTGSTSQ